MTAIAQAHPGQTLLDKLALLPLALGTAVRADVAVLGLPPTAHGHRDAFQAFVRLLAHRESQGFTYLGFTPGDTVTIDRPETDGPDDTGSALEGSEGTDLAVPSGSGTSQPNGGPDAVGVEQDDFRLFFDAHIPLWPILVEIQAASAAAGSPFMVPFQATIPANAEFVLDLERSRLLFARAAADEKRLWASINGRAAVAPSPIEPTTAATLESLFPSVSPAQAGSHEADSREEQLAAARLIVSRPISIVTGPPGTGKTFTLVRAALAWLCQQLAQAAGNPSYRPQPIRLMAPTGRASSRMRELIDDALRKIEADTQQHAALGPYGAAAIQALRDAVPTTIHNALRFSTLPGRPFKQNTDNPLAVGLVIVDETSMLGLELARQLFDALPSSSQICLVGDPAQLRAVEMGSVLFDIVSAAAKDSALAACHVRLTVSRRFPPGSMIDRLARAINGGDNTEGDLSLSELLEANRISLTDFEKAFLNRKTLGNNTGSPETAPQEATINWLEVSEAELPKVARRIASLQAADVKAHSRDPDVQATLKRSIVLAIHRKGPTGAHTLADYAVRSLPGDHGIGTFAYPDGGSLMIQQNNRGMGISNGDLAVVQVDPRGRRAVFSADKDYDLRVLPKHAPAAALTVHKAQGSEWTHVVLVLPARRTPLLTRSLLYTACTRAAHTVTILTAQPCMPVLLNPCKTP